MLSPSDGVSQEGDQEAQLQDTLEFQRTPWSETKKETHGDTFYFKVNKLKLDARVSLLRISCTLIARRFQGLRTHSP